MKQTYRICRGKWSRLSFAEQMGNIGSEVGRAISAERATNETSPELPEGILR